MKRIIATALLLPAILLAAASTPFVNHGKAERFIDIDIHALGGGSIVTQNFGSCFPEVSELDVSFGVSLGIGGGAALSFSDFLALGVEANLLVNNYRMSLAVADDDATSITNCFLKNRYLTANFPVYMSMRFNLGNSVRWNVDAGLYYTYGLWGRSKSSLYSARVNPLGQLTTSVTNSEVEYYNSPETFICSSYRGDIGLHIATGITISRRVTVAVRSQIGFKNQAHAYNAIKQPNVHNINVLCSVGYHF